MEAFVEAELGEFSTWLYEQARDRITGRNIMVDRDLLQSLAVHAARNELQVWFADHGRMHDMGAGRGYHKGKFMGVEDRGEILKGRKPSKWYSRMMWGAIFGTLVNNLANKYIAEVPGRIKQAYDKA